MKASRFALIYLLAMLPFAGMFTCLWAAIYCWDPVPTANRYNFYAGGAVEPFPTGDTEGVTWDNSPRPWECVAEVSSAACSATQCCAPFADVPGQLVYYVLTAEDTQAPGSESMPIEEPCP